MAESSSDCPYDLWDEEVVYPGKWMSVRRIKFRLKGSKNEGVRGHKKRRTFRSGKLLIGQRNLIIRRLIAPAL